MKNFASLGTVLVSLCLLQYAEGCGREKFQCLRGGACYERSVFCDGIYHCYDESDEKYCDYYADYYGCPSSWFTCHDRKRCIPGNWQCDGIKDCRDGSDEIRCDDIDQVSGSSAAREKLEGWLLDRKRNSSSMFKWGPHVHRIAVALFLGNESFFTSGHLESDQIRFEVTVRLWQVLFRDKNVGTQELALFLQALLVTCLDPRDFGGVDLVAELRKRVDGSAESINPFAVLALCNAGDTMSQADVDRVVVTTRASHRPFWADSQALSALALSCISDKTSLIIPNGTLQGILQELKAYQFQNGTVQNVKTSALVVQALLRNKEYKEDFNFTSAVKSLVDAQQEDGSLGSLLNAYYVLPVLSSNSLLNVSSSRCRKEPPSEDDLFDDLLEPKKTGHMVKLSIWIGDKTVFERSWSFRVQGDNTIYDVMESVQRLDRRQKMEYNIVNGKPYVSSVAGVEDDAELGTYWFVYVRDKKRLLKLIEQSPTDVAVSSNQEVILWYKTGHFNGTSIVPTTPVEFTVTPTYNDTNVTFFYKEGY